MILLFACNSVKTSTAGSVNISTTLPFYPLEKDADLDVLVKEIGNKRIVVLGESSHGSSEFYNWRAALSKKLILEKGFRLLAVEGDWADIYKLNNYIDNPSADTSALLQILKQYSRWPAWLWANQEFASFIKWLHDYRIQQPGVSAGVSIYGLDLFQFPAAISELIPLLHDSSQMKAATTAANCLQPYGNDALNYSRAVITNKVECAAEVKQLWELVKNTNKQMLTTKEEFLQQQLASVAYDGERYFHSHTETTSWNIRERHMLETIERLLNYAGPKSKIIVWAHNTHAGDAHYTDMPTRNRNNLGELLRNKYGEKEVYIIGGGFYQGTITASYVWGGKAENIGLVPAKKGTWEEMIHRMNGVNEILLSKELQRNKQLATWIEQRSIGVQNSVTYIPSIIPRRYDAFIYVDTSHPLHTIE